MIKIIMHGFQNFCAKMHLSFNSFTNILALQRYTLRRESIGPQAFGKCCLRHITNVTMASREGSIFPLNPAGPMTFRCPLEVVIQP